MKNLNKIPKINNLFEKFQNTLESKEKKSLFTILNSIHSLEIEFLEDYTNKKKEGVFYTKGVISNFIFTETLILLLKNRFGLKSLNKINDLYNLNGELKGKITSFLLNLKVCDPACGSGVFLVSALELLYEIIKKLDLKNHTSTIGAKLIDNIFGYDINDVAIKLTILKLSRWYSLNFKSDLNRIFYKLCSNIKKEDSITSKIDRKFDIVVGNPPYGNILTKNQKLFLKNENIFYNDIYCAYLLKAIDWCEGMIGFLVPKSFLLRQSYIRFRNTLLSNANLVKIFDIGPNLFKKATNEVQIIIYTKRIKQQQKLEIYEYPDKEIIVFKNQNFDDLRVCTNFSCPLCDKAKRIFIYSFENKCPYCTSNTISLNRIRIKTSLKIYEIINKIEHSGDMNYLNVNDFPKMIRGEEDKGLKHIKRYINQNTEGSCLFLYANYINPKLLIKHNKIVPQAIFTEEKVCFTSSIYSLLSNNNVELKYICALLNSAIIQFYCFFGINNQKNTTINLNQYMIRHLPIKPVSEQQKIQISQKVDNIIDNLHQGKDVLDQKTLHIIRELDKCIFQIYAIPEEDQEYIISELKKNIAFFKLIYSSVK